MAVKEEIFNYKLCEMLRNIYGEYRKYTIKAEETIKHGLRPDILLEIPGARDVVFECAYGGDDGKDVRGRLQDDALGLEIGIEISAPEDFKHEVNRVMDELNKGAPILDYASHHKGESGEVTRFPETGYISGSARDLAIFAAGAAVPKKNVEDVAEKVVEDIKKAAGVLEHRMPESALASLSDMVSVKNPQDALQTVGVLWLDAMLVQSHLARMETQGVEPLELKVKATRLIEQWERILEKNWRSIFQRAIEALAKASNWDAGATQEALDILVNATKEVEAGNLGEYINVGGELFPKVSPDRKEAAAFYTRPATAEFLSALLIREADLASPDKWGDPDLFSTLRVADLACGTGTLLRAAYRRIRTLSELHGNKSREGIARLHVGAMEGGLTGADVNLIASHLTNSSLALMGLGEPYKATNIGWVGVGRPIAGGFLTTGSLEFFERNEVADLLESYGSRMGGSGDTERTITVKDSDFDYIIMNPPYSRTRKDRKVFDIAGLSEGEKDDCQKRWGRMLRDQAAVKTAGMAASFLCLAREKIKPGGKIGFVLPISAAFDKSWEKTREMIIRDFENIIAITSASAGGGGDEAMSADTGMGEMLLVARRKIKRSDATPSPVSCVTLRENTGRYERVWEMAKSILGAVDAVNSGPGEWEPIRVGEQELGVVTLLPSQRGGRPWSHLGSLHPDVSIHAWKIAEEGVFLSMEESREDDGATIPMTTMDALFTTGPTHHRIGYLKGGSKMGAFTWHPIDDPADVKGKDRSLWKADCDTQIRLLVNPTHRGVLFDSAAANRIKSLAGTLHYARGIQWTSQALLAASTRNRIHGGNAWLTLGHDDERLRKGFALWANSTLGLLVHWTRGGRTQLGRALAKVKAIESMPCPDLEAIESARPGTLDKAARYFDRLSEMKLRPACEAHADETRAQIDEACVEMLGLHPSAIKTIKDLRGKWCAEPTVHGKKQKAMRLLAEAGLR